MIKQDLDIDKLKSMTKEEIEKAYVPYMYLKYKNEVVPKLKKEFNISNELFIPKIKKIIISSNTSCKKDSYQSILKKIHDSLYLLTGLKPKATMASRPISQFKIYKNTVTGYVICMTGYRMYEFIELLCHVYLVNIRDFRGYSVTSATPTTFNIGIKDMQIIPIISKYIGLTIFGATITIVANNFTKQKELLVQMLRYMDFPIFLNEMKIKVKEE